MKTKLETVLGQPGWRLEADAARLWVTRLGGFMAPVEFRSGRRVVSPYAIPHWAGAKHSGAQGSLAALRGDAFCLPFGANKRPWRGERHPSHGNIFQGNWNHVATGAADGAATLVLEADTGTRPGKVRKEVTLRDGHTVVYQRHVISGMTGRMSFGHHATLVFPERERSGAIGMSRVLFGRTHDAGFEHPAAGGYTSLRPDAVFRSLRRVPRSDGTWADLTSYPTEAGFENLVLLASDPALPLAWTTVTFADEGWLWFSLKRPSELTCTLFWMSNGGRHYAPWNGRHRRRLGLEEVTALPEGLYEAARPNVFSRAGVATCREFRGDRPLAVRSAAGVCAIPRGFDRVKDVVLRAGRIRLTAVSGAVAETRFDGRFFD
ncbi:hypothetical protein OH491_06275 [Termitidicoccus mucosus]|uniref:DUF4432 domain-containing protein n=1 Tax=Termitidicoccus mucosus TaxID=1184151 RepID=A0A178IDL0_9BACT|nr:hypothetical protein AW736_18695 [Opitutaceae bacterium TSB47]